MPGHLAVRRRQSSSALDRGQPSAYGIGRVLRPSPSTSALQPARNTPAAPSSSSPPAPLAPTLDISPEPLAAASPSQPPSLKQQQQQQPRRRGSQATLSRLLKKPSLLLRGMQSFDSGRTERPGSSASFALPRTPETPPRADPAAPPLSARHDVDGAPPEVWDWFAAVGEEDPRFVLWRTAVDPLLPLTPTFSAAPYSSHTEGSSVLDAPRVMLAATLERWVHHLTSVINPDAAFDFFLVYRSFCSPHALLSLLTTRFEWACQPSLSDVREGDVEPARVLARSRTITALAFWLTNFFEDDWVCNVVLRRELAAWLNAMRARRELDDVLGARSLLRKLKGVVKERKATFDSPAGMAAYEAKAAPFSSSTQMVGSAHTRAHSSLSPTSAFPPLFPTRRKATPTFDPSASPPPLQKHAITKLWGSIGRATRTKLSSAAGSSPASGGGRVPHATDGSSLESLFDVDTAGGGEGLEAYLSIQKQAEGNSAVKGSPSISDPETRSSHSSASTTAADDVRHAHTPHSSVGTDGTSIEDEAGRASALDMVEEERSSCEISVEEKTAGPVSPASSPRPRAAQPFVIEQVPLPVSDEAAAAPAPVSVEPSPVESTFIHSSRVDAASVASSFSSVSAVDFLPAPPRGPNQPSKPTWTPIVPFATIAMDDVSLSDSDDDDSWHSHDRYSSSAASPRRLPQGVRQLNLHRQSLEFTSQQQQQRPPSSSTDSVLSPTTGRPRARPGSAGASSTSSDQGAWHRSLLARFDVAALESDADSDDGGVDAALRRLNGEFDPERRRAREAKIERLVEANRDAWRRHDPLPVRPGSGDFDLIEPGSVGLLGPPIEIQPRLPTFDAAEADPALSELAEEAAEGETGPAERAIATVNHPSLPTLSPPARRLSAPSPHRPMQPPPASASFSFVLAHGRARSSTHDSHAHKPLSLLTSPSKQRTSSTKRRPGSASPVARTSEALARSFFPPMQPSLRHQSFILSYKTPLLAVQFSIIDAQLLNAIGFEELAGKPAPWLAAPLPALDSWEELWREKARWKVARSERASDVGMLVRRFELVVRWVETELVLTARSGRAALITLVERFVKLAAALFQLSNLQTCVAIMNGLQTPLVANLMSAYKAWPKLSAYEKRVFKDLRLITSADANWANLRKAHASILEKHGGRFFENALLGSTARAEGGAASGRSLTGATREDGFLPYMGIYLHDLRNLDIYPDFVAPRIPETVRDHLPPLPPALQSGATLINIDKATQHAQIIREVCLFKTLSSRFSTTTVEPIPFQLCFKLRTMSPEAIRNLAQLSMTTAGR